MHPRALTCGLALSLVVLLAGAGCRGLEPPYAPDAAPELGALLDAAEPSLDSIQVPRAKVRQGVGPAAGLMLVAESPGRFSGTIQIAGNELVTLAVNEEVYGLRWVGGREGAKALAPGYYEGPPSRCAVATLLGVDLEPEALVDVVLGGAPLIDGPHELLDRRWDRKQGRELVRIANASHEQELAFAWVEGAWRFVGASLWVRGAGEPQWLWTIRHGDLREVEGVLLPKKTEIRQPKANGKGEQVLNVSYQKQIPNPSFGQTLSSDPPRDGDSEQGVGIANAGDSFDDSWDDEDSWEDGEDGGESSGEEPKPEPEPKSAIPPQFVGNPTGLTPRGDLCAGR